MKTTTKVIIFIAVFVLLAAIVIAVYYCKNGFFPGEEAHLQAKREKEIEISLRENPTTGFQWSCEVSPKGIIEAAEDRYLSDSSDSDEPLDGAGGTHYWKFKVVGKGTVKIKFVSRRGKETMGMETVTYKYNCNENGAALLKVTE